MDEMSESFSVACRVSKYIRCLGSRCCFRVKGKGWGTDMSINIALYTRLYYFFLSGTIDLIKCGCIK
jgi:hypothetical protein